MQSVRCRCLTSNAMTLTPGRSVPGGIGVSRWVGVLPGGERLVDDRAVVDGDAKERVFGRHVDRAVESKGQCRRSRRLFGGKREAPGAPAHLALEAEVGGGEEVAVDRAPLRLGDVGFRQRLLALRRPVAGEIVGDDRVSARRRAPAPSRPERLSSRRRRRRAGNRADRPARAGGRDSPRVAAPAEESPRSGDMSNGACAIAIAGANNAAAAIMRRARREPVMAPSSPPAWAGWLRARRRSAA